MTAGRNDGSGVEEAICPICSMPLLADASAPAFCGLCGMGINDVEDAPGIVVGDGESLYFCCRNCCSVYERYRDLGTVRLRSRFKGKRRT